ncbi:MAG: HIT family protein [Actinomycetota bacterium]
MDRIWSPWRMEYIEAARDDADISCVFCALLVDDAEEHRVLERRELAFVTLAKYPYNPGHLLVLPTRHVGDLEDIKPDEAAEVSELLQRSVAALRETAEPHGFNIGLNLGRAAGAGIPEHLHWHVVPRWNGDTNFMPVIGETRVLPELLEQTYEKLAPRFRSA